MDAGCKIGCGCRADPGSESSTALTARHGVAPAWREGFYVLRPDRMARYMSWGAMAYSEKERPVLCVGDADGGSIRDRAEAAGLSPAAAYARRCRAIARVKDRFGSRSDREQFGYYFQTFDAWNQRRSRTADESTRVGVKATAIEAYLSSYSAEGGTFHVLSKCVHPYPFDSRQLRQIRQTNVCFNPRSVTRALWLAGHPILMHSEGDYHFVKPQVIDAVMRDRQSGWGLVRVESQWKSRPVPPLEVFLLLRVREGRIECVSDVQFADTTKAPPYSTRFCIDLDLSLVQQDKRGLDKRMIADVNALRQRAFLSRDPQYLFGFTRVQNVEAFGTRATTLFQLARADVLNVTLPADEVNARFTRLFRDVLFAGKKARAPVPLRTLLRA